MSEYEDLCLLDHAVADDDQSRNQSPKAAGGSDLAEGGDYVFQTSGTHGFMCSVHGADICATTRISVVLVLGDFFLT